MNLVLFYVWEVARIWAHWNHSFDMHLSYLGPVSCSFPSWVPSGCTTGRWLRWLRAWQRVAAGMSPSWVPSGLTVGTVVVAHGLMAAASFVCWYGGQYFSFTVQRKGLLVTCMLEKYSAMAKEMEWTGMEWNKRWFLKYCGVLKTCLGVIVGLNTQQYLCPRKSNNTNVSCGILIRNSAKEMQEEVWNICLKTAE